MNKFIKIIFFLVIIGVVLTAIYYYSVNKKNKSETQHEFKLSVPLKMQKYKFSCEAAALRSVLSFYKIELDEDTIIDLMPKDPTLHKGNTWGDPDIGFVGDIHASNSFDSYGIHWNALAKFAEKWKKPFIITDGTIQMLISHLIQNRPIIVWIYSGDGPTIGTPMYWTTSSGKKIKAISGEHTVVVIGFSGPKENPLKIIVNDPIQGEREIDALEFLKMWSSFGRKGLILDYLGE